MSSIPQNIKNEIDKIIKNVIMSSFKCNLTSLSEQFFMKNSSISIPNSRPKVYSRKNIEKYIKLQEYKLNGINIMDLYLKSYDKKGGIIFHF